MANIKAWEWHWVNEQKSFPVQPFQVNSIIAAQKTCIRSIIKLLNRLMNKH